jgi:hypothetical protein
LRVCARVASHFSNGSSAASSEGFGLAASRYDLAEAQLKTLVELPSGLEQL